MSRNDPDTGPRIGPTGEDPHPPLKMPHAGGGRIAWLDGVRACAALYVMFHHFWLSSFDGFPHDTGPWLLGWLLYGQLGVVVFIVVSGYSLALAPQRNGLRLRGGARQFARSRAWRIIPPYWASLIMSMLVVHFITAHRDGYDVTLKSLLVHGLLLQDVIGSPTPNGTFWSIAVEAQIYLLFPLLLWVARRRSVQEMALLTVAIVCFAYLLAIHVAPFARINNLTPQLLAGFAIGVFAATGRHRERQQDHGDTSVRAGAIAVAALIVLIAVLGPVKVIAHYFWIDLFAAAATGLLFRGLTLSPSCWLARGLACRPLEFIGEFSYSIYLVHGPWLSVIALYVLPSLGLSPTWTFAALFFLAGPVLLGVSFAFFQVCERPFLTVRSFAALRRYVTRTPSSVPAVDRSDVPR